ncbi:glycosyltransferase family A protein [uncultured Maricaulis sp.]|uniref:glycosyltransferase family 2 protein n=1 Tax=uncultured Maricaulis sp. TaxID=174710 RepID=UPI0026164414|nr:glycosyltransferase family A protein [uncultured Maricaulis sp.]
MTTKIEVCIPAWNEAENIAATIDALNKQTFRDFRISLFDNNSDDATIDIARETVRDIDLRVYGRTHNIGQNANINRMVLNTECEFVALVSANDLVSENYLEELHGELDRDPGVGSAYSHAIYVDDNGAPFPSQPTNWEFFSLLHDDPVVRARGSIEKYCQATNFFALYRKSILDRMQPQPFCYGGDHIFACEAALYGKVVCNTTASVRRSVPPGAESAGKRIDHLIRLFSMDQQRGLQGNSKMGAFDRITPLFDMFHGYLEMLRLSDLPHDDRARLVNAGGEAFLRRYGGGLDSDLKRFKPIAKQIAEAVQSNDILTRMMARHALRKIDECLFIKHDAELVEIRTRLSNVYCV